MSYAALTDEIAYSWRRGIPTFVFTLGPPLTVIAWIVSTWTSTAGLAESIERLVSLEYALTCVGGGFAMVGVAFCSVAPRFATACAGLLPAVSAGRDAGSSEIWPLALWGGLLVLDLVLRSGQAALLARVAGVRSKPTDVDLRAIGPLRRAVCVLLVVVGLAATGVWLERRADFVALGARAEPAIGTHQGFDEDGLAQVRVDGRTYGFWDPSIDQLTEGTDVAVMVDPEGEERPWGPEDADPDGWSDVLTIPGGATAIVLFLVGVRLRRVRALRLRADDIALRARISLEEETNRILLLPVDGTRPVAVLAGLEPLDEPPPGRRTRRPTDRFERVWDDVERFVFDGRELASMWAGDDARQILGDRETQDVDVVVRGLGAYGGGVVVEMDGHRFAALRVVQPLLVRRVLVSLVDGINRRMPATGRHEARPVRPTGSTSGGRPEPEPIELAIHGLRSTVRWSIVPAALLVGLVAWWLFTPEDSYESTWVEAGFMLFGVVSLAVAAWTCTHPPARVVGADVVLPADGVRERAIDVRGILDVRLRQDYLAIDIEDESIPVHASIPGTAHADRELSDLRDSILRARLAVAGQAAEPPISRERLSFVVVVAVVSAIPFVVGVVVATGAQMALF